MSENRIADRDLRMNFQALAVLDYLSHMEPDFAEYADGRYKFQAETYAWYNGRERGFSLTVSPSLSGPSRVFVVVEGRNHDGIVVYEWEQPYPHINGPTLEDFTDEAYREGKVFPYGAVGDAAHHIYARMEAWWEEMGSVKEAE